MSIDEATLKILRANHIYPTKGLAAPHWSFAQFTSTPILSIYVGNDFSPSLAPTLDEIKILRTYVDAVSRTYVGVENGCLEAMNTVIVQKISEGRWMYRRASWTQGPTFYPFTGLSLKELMLQHIGNFYVKYDAEFRKELMQNS